VRRLDAALYLYEDGGEMISAGDVISHAEMCAEEAASLQRGMNFRLQNRFSVLLMSLRRIE
jgi:hypothetical protein